MTHKYAKNEMREDNKEGTKPKNKDNILDIAIAPFLKSYQFFVNIYETIYSLPNTFGLRNFVVAVTQEIDGLSSSTSFPRSNIGFGIGKLRETNFPAKCSKDSQIRRITEFDFTFLWHSSNNRLDELCF